MDDFIGGMIAFVIVITIGFGLVTCSENVQCHAAWKNSGYETSYGPFKGCQVHKDGRWLPSDAVRDLVN